MNQPCMDHKDHQTRIKRNEDDIQRIWKEINAMKKWVIGGMSGLLIQIIVIIITSILVLNK